MIKQILKLQKNFLKIKMKKILVLGSNGSLGNKICFELKKNKYRVFNQTRSKKNKYFCDFKNENKFNLLLKKYKPDLIINTISNINVDECEKNFQKCYFDNIITSEIISRISAKFKIKQIYISTDQVYSGKGPHKEFNFKPLNNYGISKICAENFVLKNKGVVLRVNFLQKDKKKRTLQDKIIHSNNKSFVLFENIYFTPLHISTLVDIITKNLFKFKTGIYNIGSKNKISKASFILKLLKILNIKKNLVIKKYSNQIIPRPLDMTMNSNKIKKDLKVKFYDINPEIMKLANDYV